MIESNSSYVFERAMRSGSRAALAFYWGFRSRAEDAFMLQLTAEKDTLLRSQTVTLKTGRRGVCQLEVIDCDLKFLGWPTVSAL